MKLSDFLTNHKLTPQSIDMDDVCKLFISEMKNGLAGKDSSLAMINSYCSAENTIEVGKPVIVIDAGGTNFRTCLVTFDANMNATVSDFQNTKMPGSEKEVSAKEFFGTIADQTERLIDKSDRIGFCFSYAAKILENHDGVPLMFSKEIKAPEVIGKHLGQELFKEFTNRGFDVSNKKIIILNDTVTTLLAGLAEMKKNDCDGCVGFILGTGTNTAYIENGTIINVESGNMKLSLGDIDHEFIQGTKVPDKYMFEKMISGAYLGPEMLLILKHAVNEGVLSASCKLPETLATHEITSLTFKDKKDTEIAAEIADNFIKRAAKLTAANLAASIMKTEYGKNKPVLINADGTTFYKLAGLKENTEKFLFEYLEKQNRKAVFTKIEQSPVIGSAIGAMSI